MQAKQVNSKGEVYEHIYGLTTSQRVYGTVKENQLGHGPCYLKTSGITSEQDQDLLKAYLNMAPSQTLKWIESGKMPSEQDVEIQGTEPYIVGGHTASGFWVDEKRRLYLLSVLVSGANVLILDEPSNNVDIPTLTVLEDFLNTFVGIVITVSHDRYFLDNVVDRIFEFDGNGNLLQYEGGYTDYLEAKERRFGGSAEETAKAAPSKTSADEPAKPKNNDWKQNRPTRLKFTFKEQREYETIDDDIAALEEKIASLDDQMLKNATNSAKLAELMAEKEKSEAALEEKTERWVYLTDLAEQIEAQNQK